MTVTEDDTEDRQPRPSPISPAKRLACRIAAMRFCMGRESSPEKALDDAVAFVKAAEARWPGITKDGGVM